MIEITKNMDGTFEWKSSKIKELLEDFEGKVDDRVVTGKAGDHRTQVITSMVSENEGPGKGGIGGS